MLHHAAYGVDQGQVKEIEGAERVDRGSFMWDRPFSSMIHLLGTLREYAAGNSKKTWKQLLKYICNIFVRLHIHIWCLCYRPVSLLSFSILPNCLGTRPQFGLDPSPTETHPSPLSCRHNLWDLCVCSLSIVKNLYGVGISEINFASQLRIIKGTYAPTRYDVCTPRHFQ